MERRKNRKGFMTLSSGLVIKILLAGMILLACLPISALAADGDTLWSLEASTGYSGPAIVSDGSGGAILVGGADIGCVSPFGAGIDITHIDYDGTATTWDTSAIGNNVRRSHVIAVAPTKSIGMTTGGLLVVWEDYYSDYQGFMRSKY
ncbi:MAG: hypothetical protein DRP62_01715 [Planctomycetota bacterium]|nr:MAG: hypothetical protein DRP62_01715 [Planctomycetota bacterium]